ncbi:MAG: hypothetical protein KDB90_13710 [Planctomycetes bacterium]|nr:hypothetical protein [Planctomycetota bacterium]
MRARVQCDCGWQRELSEFYAGKRIRCPQCASVLDVPGEPASGLYNSPLPDRKQPDVSRRGRGCWVGVPNSCAPRRCCGGSWMIILIVIAISGVHLWRQIESDRRMFSSDQCGTEQLEQETPVAPAVPAQPDPTSPTPIKPEPARPAPPAEKAGEESADDSDEDEF